MRDFIHALLWSALHPHIYVLSSQGICLVLCACDSSLVAAVVIRGRVRRDGEQDIKCNPCAQNFYFLSLIPHPFPTRC